MEADPKRKLKIKSGVVKRITREYASYEEEVKRDKELMDRFKETGSDDSSMRRQEQVLEETSKMIPDARRRLRAAYDDLKDYMKQIDTIQEVTESEDWREALENLARAESEVLNHE